MVVDKVRSRTLLSQWLDTELNSFLYMCILIWLVAYNSDGHVPLAPVENMFFSSITSGISSICLHFVCWLSSRNFVAEGLNPNVTCRRSSSTAAMMISCSRTLVVVRIGFLYLLDPCNNYVANLFIISFFGLSNLGIKPIVVYQ